jgi:putative ABC transport system permease protein
MLWKLLFRNAFRHTLRAVLTVVGVAVAVLAFGLLSTLVDAWYAGVSAAAANRLVIRHAISLTFSLPIAYMEKIRAVSSYSPSGNRDLSSLPARSSARVTRTASA